MGRGGHQHDADRHDRAGRCGGSRRDDASRSTVVPPGMAMGIFQAMPSGPLGGWFGGNGWKPTRRGTSVGTLGTQGGGPRAIAEPSDALKSDFDKLQTDLQAIQDKSEVTPKLLAAVRKDFDAIQKASTSAPDEDAVKALAATVDSLAGQIPTDEQQAKLVADFTAVLQSQGVTDQTLIDTAVADIQAVVAAFTRDGRRPGDHRGRS